MCPGMMEEKDTSISKDIKPAGVLVTRGISLSIPAGGLRISLGDSEKSSVKVDVSLNMVPFWFEIALNHLFTSEDEHIKLLESRSRKSKDGVRFLESEFVAGMQAMISAAFAIDAFYALVKDHVNVPTTLSATWREKRTARYKQMAEVFKLGFKIGPKSFVALRKALHEVMKFRDFAVHPPAIASEPIFHKDLGSGVEWRFVAFASNNAHELVRTVLSIVSQLSRIPNPRHNRMKAFCDGTAALIEPSLQKWAEAYGEPLVVKNQ